KPVKFAFVNGCKDAVLARDGAVEQRLGNWSLSAKQYRIAINALAGNSVEALGNVDALDLQPFCPTGRCLQRDAAQPETISAEFMPVRGESEPDFLVHEAGFVKCHEAARVGVITSSAGGLQLDHRHTAKCFFVDNLDSKIGGGRGQRGQSKDHGSC